MKVGRFEVQLLSDGRFRLDGGAMFGVVPKNLWERKEPPDEHNRISLALGCLLITAPSGRRILVDAGLSSKYDANKKFLDVYRVERPVTLRGELKSLGLSPADIGLVINTHLHFDHAGGAFPKAKYLVQKEEWADAASPHERNQASYMEENYAPLEDSKVLELVDGEYEVEPGLKVIRSGGHTRGHQCVRIDSEGETAVYLGDLIPTRAHVPLPWIMAYDLYPVDTLEIKREWLETAAAENWTLLFQHDIGRRHAKVRKTDGRFSAVVEP